MENRRVARLRGLLLLCSIIVSFTVRDGLCAVVYRIGTPFSEAAKDSLQSLGIEYLEIDWSVSQLQEALEPDSLEVGVLQPNFFEEDEDIAATLLRRDGWVAVDVTRGRWNTKVGDVLLDQDSTTFWEWPSLAAESFDMSPGSRERSVVLVLGGRFLVREVRFRPSPDRPDQYFEQFSLGFYDEEFDTFRIPRFPIAIEVKENTTPDVRITLNTPITTKAVRLDIFRQTPKEIGIADFEVYGGGFVSKASYESDVFELPDIAAWGEISWSGRQDPEARVEIRTRSGMDPQPEIYWEYREEQQDIVKYLQGGRDLSMTEYKTQYGRFSDVQKPEYQEDWVTSDVENWSFWSASYEFENPGVGIVSPSPRQFIQIRADFASTSDDGGKIDYIELKASVPPMVRRLIGEVSPTETRVGEPTQFTYFILPTIRSGDLSFDAIEIATPSGVVSVDSLRIGGIDQRNFSWQADADGRGVEVMLPRTLETTDSGALVEVVFTALVLREVGTRFSAKVFNTQSPHEVRQRLHPGNANSDIESDRISVTTTLNKSLLFAAGISPNPFTPNGDGINDAAHISYKLLRVTTAVPVSVEIFELSGRLVKQIYAGEDLIGEYAHTWDGTDHSNSWVAPGLYVYRVNVDIQSGHEMHSGIVSVAF